MAPPGSISSQPPPNDAPAPDLRVNPRWQIIERILLTSPFQKSTNLHGLLSYLAEHSILGRTDALTERQIGIAVFGKPPGYSPAEDSAVRVHVRQLRLRLHEYFAQEGRNEILRVDIPKGSYLLEFKDSQTEHSGLKLGASPELLQPGQHGRSAIREIGFWAALIAAVICACGWYRAARANAHPAVSWPLSAVVQQNRQTRIVVSDGNLSTLRFLDPKEISLEEYLQPNFRESLIPQHVNEDFKRMLTYVSRSELTSFADLAVVSSVVKLAGPSGDQLTLASARELDRRDLEKGGYIFAGSSTSNPWVALFADKLNFQMVEEGVGGRMYFRNRNPLPGEQLEYEGLADTGSTGDDFATISVLPGRMGQGNIMILQGLRQEGTEALSVMLSDAGYRGRLEKAVRSGSKTLPYFEALIRSRAVAGAPVSVDIVAVRSIQP